jgi:CheY-like chemotaxis protein
MIERSGSPAQVLVIDDEPDHAEIVAALLGRHGYRVEVARSGEEGLARARVLVPDLILLDLFMPASDGFTVARALRAQPETRGVPIVFISACAEHAAERAGVALHDFEVLAKPFRAADLLEAAALALATRRPRG